jgi:predicted nucleic acid-binding protein
VTIDDALRTVHRLFLDTAPVIYFVERNPTYTARVDDIFDRLDKGTPQAATSPITLAECLIGPLRLGLLQAQQTFTDLLVAGPHVTFVRLDDAIARQAAELRVRYGLQLADSFQIAAALAASCEAFLTNDRGLQRVRELAILVLDDLQL